MMRTSPVLLTNRGRSAFLKREGDNVAAQTKSSTTHHEGLMWALRIGAGLILLFISYIAAGVRSDVAEFRKDTKVIPQIQTDIAVMKHTFRELLDRDLPTRQELEASIQKLRIQLIADVQTNVAEIQREVRLLERAVDRESITAGERENRLDSAEKKIQEVLDQLAVLSREIERLEEKLKR